MHWQQIGYQHERYVDESGRIVGDVEYRPGGNEVVATMRVPEFRALGAYITLDKAKAAVERAHGVTAAPAPEVQQALETLATALRMQRNSIGTTDDEDAMFHLALLTVQRACGVETCDHIWTSCNSGVLVCDRCGAQKMPGSRRGGA